MRAGKLPRNCTIGHYCTVGRSEVPTQMDSQSVSQLFHGPAPRSPLHRLAVRLRHSRSNTSTEYSDAQTNPKRHTARLSVTCSVADFASH